MALKDQIGSICWWSLMTRDVAKANSFYQNLFGWKLEELEFPGGDKSTIYAAGKGGFGNPVPLEEEFPGPSHWIPYVAVEDVDETCNRVGKIGGKVCVPAFDIPTIGRTAVINDPVGAALHIFTPTNTEEEMNMVGSAPGEICWIEMLVEDPAPLLTFYSEMFGWKFLDPMDLGDREYFPFEARGEQVGGIMKRPPEVSPMPPVWMNYFLVSSLDEASEKVRTLGGEIMMDKMEIPKIGAITGIQDPTGAFSYLFESANA